MRQLLALFDVSISLTPSLPRFAQTFVSCLQNQRQIFGEMTYYCGYAVASYGPLMYLCANTSCGLCAIANECL